MSRSVRGSPNEAPPPLAQTWANAMPIVDLGAGVFGGTVRAGASEDPGGAEELRWRT